MKFLIRLQSQTSVNFLRTAQYGPVRGKSGISYSKRIDRNDFPRFHLYIEDVDEGMIANLHLDQKAACYSGSTAHAGEYDGEIVATEAKRLLGLAN